MVLAVAAVREKVRACPPPPPASGSVMSCCRSAHRRSGDARQLWRGKTATREATADRRLTISPRASSGHWRSAAAAAPRAARATGADITAQRRPVRSCVSRGLATSRQRGPQWRMRAAAAGSGTVAPPLPTLTFNSRLLPSSHHLSHARHPALRIMASRDDKKRRPGTGSMRAICSSTRGGSLIMIHASMSCSLIVCICLSTDDEHSPHTSCVFPLSALKSCPPG